MENMHTLVGIIGQMLFGGYFLWNGIKHFIDHKTYTLYATSRNVPMASTAVYFTGLLLLLGGLGVLFNVFKTFSLLLLAIFIILVTFKMHQFWKITDLEEKSGETVTFLKNLALLGAVFLMI